MANLAETRDSLHLIQEEEVTSLTEYINAVLKDAAELKEIIPLSASTDALTAAVASPSLGPLFLGDLINTLLPGSIDAAKLRAPRNTSKFTQLENLNTVFDAAKRIGCKSVNLSAEDLVAGKPVAHLICGLLWQILQIGLETKMNLALKSERISTSDHQELIIEWVNSHLKAAASDRTVKNLGIDLADSVVYTVLLHQLFPETCSLDPLKETDPVVRARQMLSEADKIASLKFVTPITIVRGVTKLNFAFLANLFALKPSDPRPLTSPPAAERKVWGPAASQKGFRARPLDGSLKAVASEPDATKKPKQPTEEVEQLRAEKARLQEQITKLEAEVQKRSNTDDVDARLKVLESQLLVQQAATIEALEQADTLRKKLAEAEAALASARAPGTAPAPAPAPGPQAGSTIQRPEQELAKAKATIAELEARVSERKDLLATLDALEAKLDEVSRGKEQLHTRVKQLEEQLAEAKGSNPSTGANGAGIEPIGRKEKGCNEKAAPDHDGSKRLRQESIAFPKELFEAEIETLTKKNQDLELKLKAYQNEENLLMHVEQNAEDTYISIPVKDVRPNSARTGFLTKHANSGSSWKRRFFILRENYLFYWKSNKDTDKKAKSIRLNGGTVEALASGPETDKRPNVFAVRTTQGRKYMMAAEDATTQHEWITSLQMLLKTLPPPPAASDIGAQRRQRYSTLQRIKLFGRSSQSLNKEEKKDAQPAAADAKEKAVADEKKPQAAEKDGGEKTAVEKKAENAAGEEKEKEKEKEEKEKKQSTEAKAPVAAAGEAQKEAPAPTDLKQPAAEQQKNADSSDSSSST